MRIATLISAFILIASSFAFPMANAAEQQSVNVNSSVFFTLSSASLTAGANTQMLNFTLRLTNQSTQIIDLNQYGVKVNDNDGNVYTAQLSEIANARVLPNLSQDFLYVSQVPQNISASQLSIHVFAWDFSAPPYTHSLGSLDVAPATSNPVHNIQVNVKVSDLDPTLPDGTSAVFELVRSYQVLKEGVWSVYTDLMVHNLSASEIHIPTNLGFQLKEDSLTTDAMDITSGGSQAIPAKQQNLITLHASLKNPTTTHHFSLELSNKMSRAALGSFALDGSFPAAEIGSHLNVATKNSNAFDMMAGQASYTTLTYALQVNTKFTISNNGQSVLNLPVISAAYQVDGSTISNIAYDDAVHPETLSPNQSTTYSFTQSLPKGVDSSKVQLVVSVKLAYGVNVTRPIDVVSLTENQLSADGSTSVISAINMQDYDATVMNPTNVTFQAARSYQVTANGNPALNVDMVAINESANAITLPSSLLFNLRDSAGSSYQAALISGAGQTFQPHQRVNLTLQATVAGKDTSTQYSLDFVKKGALPTDANLVRNSFNLADSFAVTTGSNAVNAALGRMGITLKSTYRLASQSGADVWMSEVQIQNLDNKVISLPNQTSFYGGYRIGDFDAQGKVINLQSSAILYPNQTTSVYIYTQIPYTTPLTAGYLYLGDGTLNTQTSLWTQTHEWTELPFTANTTAIPQIAMNSPWTITDAGRASTGQIVDSQIYDIQNKKMLAIRILDTNKEVRNGSIVPYTGYFTNSDGTVVSLSTTDDSAATKVMSKEGAALTTLWAVLPSGASTSDQQAIFGQKIADQTFASPLQYAFASATTSSDLQSASMYPYTISVQNTKLTSSSSGYDVNFDYAISKTLDAAGIAKDRVLEFALTDNAGKVVKTWDYTALEGTGALLAGRDKLSLTTSEVADLVTFLSYTRQLNVYEKFEGGTRLLGSIAVNF